MTEAVGAEKGERTEGRLGYRSGYYPRALITRVGKIELRVPQDRGGRFSTELFGRTSARKRRWSQPWPRCMCRASRRGRFKQVTEELVGQPSEFIVTYGLRTDPGVSAERSPAPSLSPPQPAACDVSPCQPAWYFSLRRSSISFR
jgi:hypothetical protein